MSIDLRTTENRYETNPFMVELKGKMFLQPRANMIIAKGENIVNTSTGEILKETTLIGRRKIVDKSQFAKIYASDIALIYNLNKPAINVFLYLTKVMDYENKAYLVAEKDCKKIGYKTALSVSKGIKELIKNDIIAPAIMQGYYWLNPTIVCKGERFAKYTEYLTEEEARREREYMLKKQGKDFVNMLPEDIEQKYTKANSQIPTDDLNEKLPFPDESPYIKQYNTNGGIDLINPETGEIYSNK